jgi:hypothetical protein
MNMAVRIGRTIMEDIQRTTLTLLSQQIVKPHPFPFSQSLRFSLGKIGLHGKISLRKV